MIWKKVQDGAKKWISGPRIGLIIQYYLWWIYSGHGLLRRGRLWRWLKIVPSVTPGFSSNPIKRQSYVHITILNLVSLCSVEFYSLSQPAPRLICTLVEMPLSDQQTLLHVVRIVHVVLGPIITCLDLTKHLSRWLMAAIEVKTY